MIFGCLMQAQDMFGFCSPENPPFIDETDLYMLNLQQSLDGQQYSRWEKRPSFKVSLGVAGLTGLGCFGIITSLGNGTRDEQVGRAVISMACGFIGFVQIAEWINGWLNGSAKREKVCAQAARHYRDVLEGRAKPDEKIQSEASVIFEEIRKRREQRTADYLKKAK